MIYFGQYEPDALSDDEGMGRLNWIISHMEYQIEFNLEGIQARALSWSSSMQQLAKQAEKNLSIPDYVASWNSLGEIQGNGEAIDLMVIETCSLQRIIEELKIARDILISNNKTKKGKKK